MSFKEEKLKIKFGNINYIGLAAIVIGLLPTGANIFIPNDWTVMEIASLFLFGIFAPLILFYFMDDIKDGFNNASLRKNILWLSSLLLFAISVLSIQTLNLITN